MGFIMRENSKYFDTELKDDREGYTARANGVDENGNQIANKPEKREMIQFKNGIKYDGEWVGADRWGYGVQVWPDGAKYEGHWANNKASGKGKFTHIYGDVYEGDWKDDKACGFGVYTHAKTNARYEGYWENDMQHGSGI